MTRSLLPRLIALVVVIVLGTYYVVSDVLHYSFGRGPYSVTLRLPRGGGIYTSADVTYRGVGIGRVSAVDVRPDGVDVTLHLDHDSRVPSDVDADVRQLSAIGEQYVDLVPRTATGQLRQGSVIPADRAHLPVPIGAALSSLGSLLDSLPSQDVATVESFLTTGFTGTDQDLRSLIVNSETLVKALAAAQPQTAALITNGTPVLQTFQSTAPQLQEWAADLNQLSATIASSDSDLQALLAKGGPSTDQLAGLLAKTRTDIAGTISGFGSSAAAFLAHQPQAQAMFEMLPVVAVDLRDITAGGTVRSTLTVNGGRTVCSYLPAGAFPLPTQRTTAVDMDNGCARSAADLLQRGAATAP